MKEDVLRFEVSVQDIVIVHVLHSMADLFDYGSDFVLGEGSETPEVLVEVAIYAKFHQQEEITILHEDRIQLNDVRVVQEGLDSDLPNSLHENSRVRCEQGPIYLLQST